MMSVQGLEKLDVWRKAKDFAVIIYREVLPLLPSGEKWGLNQQLRRAAQSIPANIAEGHGRYYYQENIRFCYIARGSLVETISHLSLAHELEYIPDELFKKIVSVGDEQARLINGYIAYLKRSKKGANEPGSSRSIKEPPEFYLTDDPNFPPDPTE